MEGEGEGGGEGRDDERLLVDWFGVSSSSQEKSRGSVAGQ